jgi:phage antirepressor YoqD-like protein
MKTLQIDDGFEITTSELAQEMGIKHKSLIQSINREDQHLLKKLSPTGETCENYSVVIITKIFLLKILDYFADSKLKQTNLINAIHSFVLKNKPYEVNHKESGSHIPIKNQDPVILTLEKQKELATKWLETIKYAEVLEQEKIQMEQIIEEREPLYEFGKTLSKSESLMEVRDVAKTLHITNIFKLLHAKGIFHYKYVSNNKRENKGRSYGVPKKEFIDRGYFELKQGTYDTPKGETRTYLKPMVTAKGELFIQRLFMKNTQKLIGG